MNGETPAAVTRVGASMAPRLEITQGENKGESFPVKMTTRIGRERDNDVVLLDLKSSRHHAEVSLAKGGWLLIDLGSANGTLLNGQPVTAPVALQHGDRIGVGETEMVFSIPGQPEVSGPPKPVEVPRRGDASGPIPVMPSVKTPPPSSSRLVWLVGGAILVLCVVAVLVVYLLSNRLSNGTVANNATPPPAETPASPPESAVVTPTNLGQPSQPGEVPGRPEELSLVYEENFSDSFSGWDDAFDAYTRKVYGNNRYNIEVQASNLVAWGLANRIVSDFEVEVEAKLEDGAPTNSYGLLFRFTDRENFYRFDVSGDGYFLFSKFVDGQWLTLVDWTRSEFINAGGAANILKVSAFGPYITLWANGQQLVSLEDDSLQRGNFGFFTGTFADPTSWVSFDNLKMWTRPDEEMVLIPTATPLGGIALIQPTTPTATPIPVAAATAIPQEALTATVTLTAEVSSVVAGSVLTPTVAATPTPEPLPEYASRDQTLARGEQQVTGQVIFPVYDAKAGTYNIYRADIAGGGNLQLLQPNASQPAVNSKFNQLAYRSWQADRRGLFARPLDDSKAEAWGFDLFFESARPQFSPGNDELIYYSRTGGKDPALYKVLDGIGQVMRYESVPVQGKSPKWSPDRTKIVYSSCLGGSCGIVLSNGDGSGQTLLTTDPTDTNPEISPDGQTVVFMSNRSGKWEIYRVDTTGENLQALTTDKVSDGLPTWSADGSKIAFVSNLDGAWGVWVMNADGSNKRRQFDIEGTVDGVVQIDPNNSFGWVEENIVWIP
jgi:pSer/pThr/pTyr-binding forkhead associated (FHA) protein